MHLVPAGKQTHSSLPKGPLFSAISRITSNARPMPGRKSRKNEKAIGNQWPIGKFLWCRNNEVLKLWGASTNEQMVVEMPMKWHERVRAQLNDWTNEPMNQWMEEPMNQWISESLNHWINEATKQWLNEASNQWTNESMTQRINEPVNQWISEPVNHWINEERNQRINELVNKWTWGRGWMTKASGVGERRKGRGELRRDCHHRVAALFVPTRMQQWYMIYDI